MCVKRIEEDVYDYIPPVDEKGDVYWVPYVVKNRDFLIGFLKGKIISNIIFDTVMENMDIDIAINVDEITMDSKRFCDVLPNGKRLRDLTEQDFENYMREDIKRSMEYYESNNKENDLNILDVSLLSFDCPNCGGYYSFEKEQDVPDQDFSCSICGHNLILYTGVDDYKIRYDGK
jgi:predicted RNA-binding Zn-ribbon protein involved in translation (DUF1610 family)